MHRAAGSVFLIILHFSWRTSGRSLRKPLQEDSQWIITNSDIYLSNNLDPFPGGKRWTELDYVSTRAPPPGFERWLDFADQNRCHMGSYQRIDRDMQAFVDPSNSSALRITKKQIDEASLLENVATLTIKNGALSMQGQTVGHASEFAAFMHRFVSQLPDLRFVLNAMDEPRILPGVTEDIDTRLASSVCEHASPSFKKHRHLHGFFNNRMTGPSYDPQTKLLPLFSQSKINECHRDILYPTLMNLNSLLNQDQIQSLLPWEERSSDLFWRGSTTGGGFHTSETHRKAHRQRLVRSAKAAEHMDIHFSGMTQCSNGICEEMTQEYGMAERINIMDNFKHKFLMSVDGNSFVSRLPKFLSSGSLSFRAGLFNEWFDEWLIPEKHFLQVELDYSDLQSKLDWARTHDAEARRMGLEARAFARQRLRNEDMECYVFRLLLEYANIAEN